MGASLGVSFLWSGSHLVVDLAFDRTLQEGEMDVHLVNETVIFHDIASRIRGLPTRHTGVNILP